jgi:acetyltransferase-like isoleucine patch superfamily enzyme
MNGFYTEDELRQLGLAHIGNNVLISKFSNFYNTDQISIESNVRIDDFCVLSGKIIIGNHVHIGAGCVMYGGNEGIFFEDFTGVSSKCAIYAITDSYDGNALTNPTVPIEYRDIIYKRVILRRHSLVGTNCVILPGVTLEEGCSVTALSLITHSLPPWMICGGHPARALKNRNKDILRLEQEYLQKHGD